MKRTWIVAMGMAMAMVAGSLTGCQSPAMRGQCATGQCSSGQCATGQCAMGSIAGTTTPTGPLAGMHAHNFQGPQSHLGSAPGPAAGPPAPTVGYPYYTTRGPRDFLSAQPPSIGR